MAAPPDLAPSREIASSPLYNTAVVEVVGLEGVRATLRVDELLAGPSKLERFEVDLDDDTAALVAEGDRLLLGFSEYRVVKDKKMPRQGGERRVAPYVLRNTLMGELLVADSREARRLFTGEAERRLGDSPSTFSAYLLDRLFSADPRMGRAAAAELYIRAPDLMVAWGEREDGLFTRFAIDPKRDALARKLLLQSGERRTAAERIAESGQPLKAPAPEDAPGEAAAGESADALWFLVASRDILDASSALVGEERYLADLYRQAIHLLGMYGDRSYGRHLYGWLQSDHPAVVEAALRALERLFPDSRDRIVEGALRRPFLPEAARRVLESARAPEPEEERKDRRLARGQ